MVIACANQNVKFTADFLIDIQDQLDPRFGKLFTVLFSNCMEWRETYRNKTLGVDHKHGPNSHRIGEGKIYQNSLFVGQGPKVSPDLLLKSFPLNQSLRIHEFIIIQRFLNSLAQHHDIPLKFDPLKMS